MEIYKTSILFIDFYIFSIYFIEVHYSFYLNIYFLNIRKIRKIFQLIFNTKNNNKDLKFLKSV